MALKESYSGPYIRAIGEHALMLTISFIASGSSSEPTPYVVAIYWKVPHGTPGLFRPGDVPTLCLVPRASVPSYAVNHAGPPRDLG